MLPDVAGPDHVSPSYFAFLVSSLIDLLRPFNVSPNLSAWLKHNPKTDTRNAESTSHWNALDAFKFFFFFFHLYLMREREWFVCFSCCTFYFGGLLFCSCWRFKITYSLGKTFHHSTATGLSGITHHSPLNIFRPPHSVIHLCRKLQVCVHLRCSGNPIHQDGARRVGGCLTLSRHLSGSTGPCADTQVIRNAN